MRRCAPWWRGRARDGCIHTVAIGVVIIGAGGFGRHVHATLLRAIAAGTATIDGEIASFAGFLDDGAPDAAILGRLGAGHLGPVAALRDQPPSTRYLLAIGNGAVRRRIDAAVTGWGYAPMTLIDPVATIGTDIRLGAGAIVCSGARLETNIETGRHVHVSENCTVGHDTTLADYVTAFPQAAIAGNVHIGAGTTVGTQAAIIQGLTVGGGVMIGAGAVVIRDVPDDVTAVGVPARYLPGDSGAVTH
jgi:sugar O-acyltransferase (sialic acid O-acetyltransferase NeuD family)